jgi:cyclopropane fatty-acyl-phospholipid synthase-like methyltransferase
MKYYEMHEPVYQKLQQNGHLTWDKDDKVESLLTSTMNLSLKDHFPDLKSRTTLDLGTGAGGCALYCASQGAAATGVDLSQTAIIMAQKNALALKLTADFMAADILELKLSKKFDLITDSSLLHCLIGSDRQKFYETVKTHLKPKGHLYIHTMVESQDMSQMIDPNYFLYEYPIFWSLGFNEITQGRKEFQGKSYFPHRTILSEQDFLLELGTAGFNVVSQKLHDKPQSPGTLTLLAQWTPDS